MGATKTVHVEVLAMRNTAEQHMVELEEGTLTEEHAQAAAREAATEIAKATTIPAAAAAANAAMASHAEPAAAGLVARSSSVGAAGCGDGGLGASHTRSKRVQERKNRKWPAPHSAARPASHSAATDASNGTAAVSGNGRMSHSECAV